MIHSTVKEIGEQAKVKIILSRKGFDSTNGGIPSPILPDGTLLSMPVPSEDTLAFSDLCYDGHTYRDVLHQLAPKRQYNRCHLDPDIREGVRVDSVPGWKPAFGQGGSAQGYLRNKGIKPGDLFLFFGRFRQTTGSLSDGTLRFEKKAPTLHIIYGYMEIGSVVMNNNLIEISKEGYLWHPHGTEKYLDNKTNALYLPTQSLSFKNESRGWGILSYAKKRVLTLSAKTATWREIPCLMPEMVAGNRSNSATGGGIYYRGIWQELALKENILAVSWAKEIILS